jgi:hypothetical protein
LQVAVNTPKDSLNIILDKIIGVVAGKPRLHARRAFSRAQCNRFDTGPSSMALVRIRGRDTGIRLGEVPGAPNIESEATLDPSQRPA